MTSMILFKIIPKIVSSNKIMLLGYCKCNSPATLKRLKASMLLDSVDSSKTSMRFDLTLNSLQYEWVSV